MCFLCTRRLTSSTSLQGRSQGISGGPSAAPSQAARLLFFETIPPNGLCAMYSIQLLLQPRRLLLRAIAMTASPLVCRTKRVLQTIQSMHRNQSLCIFDALAMLQSQAAGYLRIWCVVNLSFWSGADVQVARVGCWLCLVMAACLWGHWTGDMNGLLWHFSPAGFGDGFNSPPPSIWSSPSFWTGHRLLHAPTNGLRSYKHWTRAYFRFRFVH